MAPSAFDASEFRKALGTFVTGVTVVSTLEADGSPRGFTANSFTSVSLDPPLLLVCVGKQAASCPVFAAASHFAINILAEEQRAISGLFASKRPDKFQQVAWTRGPLGSPLIEGAVAWFDCGLEQTIDAGDHLILLGRVADFRHGPAAPLGYYRGAYLTFGLVQQAEAAAASQTTRVGALLERDGALAFVEQPDGRLRLPLGQCLEPAGNPASLRGQLAALGLRARLDFLFAVFEDPQIAAGSVSIFYRGALLAPPPPGPVRLIPFDAIPWPRIDDAALVTMLRRYIKERQEDVFGVYVGDAERGVVQPLARPA